MPGKLKTVFMGTPDFAAKCLDGLLNAGAEIPLVITRPDRPKGRGLRSAPSPVKELALSKGIEVLTPDKIKSEDTLTRLKNANPDLFWVAAYGKILPKSVLSIPRLYSINVHASLLPKYRGAAPINWAIIRGEARTGITMMKMNEKMDEGDIMMTRESPILDDDDSETLGHRLADIAGDITKIAYETISKGEARFAGQNHSEATYAPMLKKGDGLIDWGMSSKEIHNFIRGMNPWPGSYSFLKGRMIKIFKTELDGAYGTCAGIQERAGQVVELSGGSIKVKTGDSVLTIRELQMESRRRMPACDFISGGTIKTGDMFAVKP